MGLISGLGRSPGEGNGNILHIFAREIPWTEEPGRLQYMGLQRVGHDLVTKTNRKYKNITSFRMVDSAAQLGYQSICPLWAGLQQQFQAPHLCGTTSSREDRPSLPMTLF